MKRIVLIVILIFFLAVICPARTPNGSYISLDSLPSSILGKFVDDYGIHYQLSDSLWFQEPDAKYHIIWCDIKEGYIIARNDDHNASDGGLFTRIDYMYFTGMEPWTWGFCLTVYDAKDQLEAKTQAKADREDPKKGCGGYPFSRMKRVQ